MVQCLGGSAGADVVEFVKVQRIFVGLFQNRIDHFIVKALGVVAKDVGRVNGQWAVDVDFHRRQFAIFRQLI